MFSRTCIPILGLSAVVLSGCGGSGTFNAPTVLPPPAAQVSISVKPAAVLPGQNATLSWSASNATTCTASGAWKGEQPTSGSETLTLASIKSVPYTLTCTGPGGDATATANLSVAEPIVECAVKPAVRSRADRRTNRHRRPSLGTSGL